jgi:hypothetical protein
MDITHARRVLPNSDNGSAHIQVAAALIRLTTFLGGRRNIQISP